MTVMNKQELRALLRARHKGAQARDRQSEQMCRHILESDWYKSAKLIGGYMPMPREADVIPVMKDALRQGKMLALPLCGEKPDMTFRRICSLDDLIPGAYGLLEPAEDASVIAVEDIDLLLVPLEGIDQDGYRLGKGGGYYDKALTRCCSSTLGCAMTWQWVEEVPREPWDVRLQACADENGIHMFML